MDRIVQECISAAMTRIHILNSNGIIIWLSTSKRQKLGHTYRSVSLAQI